MTGPVNEASRLAAQALWQKDAAEREPGLSESGRLRLDFIKGVVGVFDVALLREMSERFETVSHGSALHGDSGFSANCWTCGLQTRLRAALGDAPATGNEGAKK